MSPVTNKELVQVPSFLEVCNMGLMRPVTIREFNQPMLQLSSSLVGLTAVVTSDAIFNKAALAQHDYDRIAERAKDTAAIAANSERLNIIALKCARSCQRIRAVMLGALMFPSFFV